MINMFFYQMLAFNIHGKIYKNKVTGSSIFEYLLLKIKINDTKYFAKKSIGIIS